MADIELVIKIDEDTLKRYQASVDCEERAIIAHGTLLPTPLEYLETAYTGARACDDIEEQVRLARAIAVYRADVHEDCNVLDEIKAEIKEEAEHAYADFEQYKVEYLGQDWEDVLDSLPQDDFRYGMERAVEIINKHIWKEKKQC